MRKFLAIITKETRMLLQDKIGLSILFIMPLVLIVVMTVIQDAAFHSISEEGVPLIFVDNDKDSLGISIGNGLKNHPMCSFSDQIKGKPATIETAKEAVSEGKFMIAVIIPENATKRIRSNVEELVGETMGLTEINDIQNVADSLEIMMYIDPIAKNSIVITVTSSLKEFIAAMKTKLMFETFSEQIAEITPDGISKPTNAYTKTQIVSYKQEFVSKMKGGVTPNAVQHNVPAWTIFGIFFIVVSIVSNIMKEKKDGSAFRLHTMPTSYSLLIFGKLIVYVTICTLQFFSMILVGVYFMPILGMDSLNLGDSFSGLLFLGVSTGFAATSFGVLIGTVAQSEQQGAILGSLLVLLLSALGGIWVPSYVMPSVMRAISEFSPMNWAMDGFYKLLFRGEGFFSTFVPSLKLLAISFIFLLGASLFNHYKKRV
jgi:ABC-2 type transport system permease protein